MTLRRKLLLGTLAVAAVTIAAGITGGVLIQREVRRAAHQELTRQAQVTAQLIENELERTPLRNRREVASVLNSVALLGDHDYVEAAVLRADGAMTPLVAGSVLLPGLAAGGLESRVTEVDVAGTSVLATAERVELGAGRRTLLVAIGNIEDLQIAGVITRTVVIALSAGAVVAVALAVGLSRSLGRRLDVLGRRARSYAEGDFDARVPEIGDDELSAVGQAFNEMAEELGRARRRERDFLMSVGHDLRTPLTTIRGYAEGLDAGAVDQSDIPRVATVIHTQTDRLSRLIEDLMLLARLEAREFTLRPEPVDLAAHLKETIAAARIKSDAARVRIDDDLEPVGLLVVDPDRVDQIVTNLLDNALRYTPEGGTVRVCLATTADGARIEVADNGPGIETADLEHVFERLYVAQHYRPLRPEGSGLGLAITKELVDAMEGDIAVSSVPGAGTTVVVSLVASEVGAEATS